MKTLRRRAIAKAVGMKYITLKCGGYELRGTCRTVAIKLYRVRWYKATDEQFIRIIRMCVSDYSLDNVTISMELKL